MELRSLLGHFLCMKDNPSFLDVSGVSLAVCRGACHGPCPFKLDVGDFPEVLAEILRVSGWPEFLAERLGRAPRKHEELRLSVAACANGCSRPHVADMGFIMASRPAVDPDRCEGCGICAGRCPDRAIDLEAGVAAIDRRACLDCGQCIVVCPKGAMVCEAQGFRVLVGGRLGRRPRLAVEAPGLRTPGECADLVQAAAAALMKTYRRGRRLADALLEANLPGLGVESNERN